MRGIFWRDSGLGPVRTTHCEVVGCKKEAHDSSNPPKGTNVTEQADRESYEGQQVDPEDQLQSSDTLDNEDLVDVLDQGFSPPDREPHDHTGPARNLDEWLAMEEPEPDPYALDPGIAEHRAGRLVAPDEGTGEDSDSEAVARDVGIDGAGASAEEAAMHVIDEDDDLS